MCRLLYASAFNSADNLEKVLRFDAVDGFLSEPGKNVFLKAAHYLRRMTYRPCRFMARKPLSCNQLKSIGGLYANFLSN